MLLSDLCLTSDCLSSCLVAYIGPNSKTKRPTKIKIGTEVAHVTRDSDTTFSHCSQKVKGQGHQAALVGCTDRPTWTYSNGDLSICVHNVYRVTTCRPWRGAYRGGRPPIYSLLRMLSMRQMNSFITLLLVAQSSHSRKITANRSRVSIRVTNVGQGRGHGRPSKIFLSSSLIITQTLVALGQTASQKFYRDAGSRLFALGRG